MILQRDAPGREALLEALRPHVGWDGLAAEQVAELQEILESGRDEAFPGILIPVITADADGRYVGFYAAADTLTQWRVLQPLLVAALGSTLTTFDGRQLRRTSEAPIERLLKGAGLVLARFRAAPGTKLEERKEGSWCPRHGTQKQSGARCASCSRRHGSLAIEAARRIRRQAVAAPAIATLDMRSGSRLLYEFDMALLAGDQDAAETLIAELRERRLLDTLNLHFLYVRLDAEFEEWGRLAERDWFEDLCRTRRPAAVTSALVEAATRTFLAANSDATAAQLVALFRTNVLPRTGTLFARPPEERSPIVATGFLLRALAAEETGGVAGLRSQSTDV